MFATFHWWKCAIVIINVFLFVEGCCFLIYNGSDKYQFNGWLLIVIAPLAIGLMLLGHMVELHQCKDKKLGN